MVHLKVSKADTGATTHHLRPSRISSLDPINGMEAAGEDNNTAALHLHLAHLHLTMADPRATA